MASDQKMMSIVGISGNIERPSKTCVLIDTMLDRIDATCGIKGTTYDLLDVPELGAAWDFSNIKGRLADLIAAIETADVLVVGSPVVHRPIQASVRSRQPRSPRRDACDPHRDRRPRSPCAPRRASASAAVRLLQRAHHGHGDLRVGRRLCRPPRDVGGRTEAGSLRGDGAAALAFRAHGLVRCRGAAGELKGQQQ